MTFVNIQSVDRIVYAIFNRFNIDWQKRPPSAFLHTQLDITPTPVELVLLTRTCHDVGRCPVKRLPRDFNRFVHV